MKNQLYKYTSPNGTIFEGYIEHDYGLINDFNGDQWHKVTFFPIGFNSDQCLIADKGRMEPINLVTEVLK